MQKLSEKEFSYYKGWISESKKEHDTKMKNLNIPEAVIQMYQGLLQEKEVYENYMLIAVQTLIPTLFYQFPRPIIKRKTGRGSDYSASVIEAVVKHYINDDWKIENQLCILDAYLAYGYGVMKVAYNSRVGRVNKPSILTGETKSIGNENVEDDEYIRFEHPVIQRVSPRDTYLDHTKPFHQGQRITFDYKRTLQELIDSNIYNLSSEFINYFKGKSDNSDARKVKFDLHEHFCTLESGVYKLCYVDEWDEPLFWEKTAYKKLPVALLRFTKTPDELYAVSQGKLAYNAQKELDYLNEIWKQHVDKIRRQHLVWEEALTESGKKVLEMNEIDGIVKTSQPVSGGVYAQIGSNPMGKDVYANIENVRNYLKLLLSTTGGRGGGSDVEFAETEKQQAQGDFMRSSGFQDNIRDFVRKQLRLTVSNVYYLGSPDMTVKISGKDVIDPKTGEIISGKYLKLGGETGLNFQEEVGGDVESDYLYDCDITSASRPDYAVIRKQLTEALMLLQTLRPAINEKGKDIDIATLAQDYLNTFDALPDPEKYFVDLTPEQKAMIEQNKMMAQIMAQQGKKLPQGVPNEKAIETGIQNQATGVGI
jgi:hypothetical protein